MQLRRSGTVLPAGRVASEHFLAHDHRTEHIMRPAARTSQAGPSTHAHPSTRTWQRPVLERLGSWRALTMQTSSPSGGVQEIPIGPGNA
jgi:hypothetical protein